MGCQSSTTDVLDKKIQPKIPQVLSNRQKIEEILKAEGINFPQLRKMKTLIEYLETERWNQFVDFWENTLNLPSQQARRIKTAVQKECGLFESEVKPSSFTDLRLKIFQLLEEENIKLTLEEKNSCVDRFLEDKNISIFLQLIPQRKQQIFTLKLKQVWEEQVDKRIKQLIHQKCCIGSNDLEEEQNIMEKIKSNKIEEIISGFVGPRNQEQFRKKLNEILQFRSFEKQQRRNTHQEIGQKNQQWSVTAYLEEQEQKLNLNKNMSFKEQKYFVEEQLKHYLKTKHKFLFLFQKENDLEEIENDERSLLAVEKEKGRLQRIEVIFYFQIYVEGEHIDEIIPMNSNQTILDLKKEISNKHNIVLNALELSLNIKDEQKQVILDNQTKISLSNLRDENPYCSLKLKIDLEHYGFHKNCKISAKDYLTFFRETEQAEQKLISFCDPDDSEKEIKFQSSFLRFCYSAIKKGFLIQTVIEKYRNKFHDNIWTNQKRNEPLTFNSLFVLAFILYNSDETARTIIMNQAKTYLPLPTHFRIFKSIQEILPEFKRNNELKYILSDGLTVVSLGLHSKNRKRQAGKTDFLSKVFYTDMVRKQNLHGIINGCPLLYLNVFSNIFPLHLIDIPEKFPEEHYSEILNYADLIIVHSWLDKEETKKRVESYESKCKIYYRDRDQMSKMFTSKQIERSKEIFLPNISEEKQNDNIYMNIRNQLLQQIQGLSGKGSLMNIYELTSDQTVKKLLKILNEVQKNIFQINIVGREIEQFRKGNQENFQWNITQKGLHPVVTKLFYFLHEITPQKRSLLSVLLRNKLHQIKNRCNSPFNMLFQLENKALNIDFSLEADVKQLEKMCQLIRQLPIIKKQIEREKIDLSVSSAQNRKQEFQKNLRKMIYIYENQIKPNIFSLELLWRQMVGLIKFSTIPQIGGIQAKEMFIQLKRQQLREQQPFEIIDGDLLQMNQKVILQTFKSFPEKVCVISVLGPQSSGKSTLLNFLFGCSFATSIGRCTRGVYGTYFQLHSTQLLGCDGIFLVDTEGILANTAQKDQEKRNNFDTKLILFCLSISDIVIINTKGNLDKTTSQIVALCSEKLEILVQEQNQPRPYLFLTLNQNNNANIQECAQDIARLRQELDIQPGGANQLSQAYQIQQIRKDQIKLLPKNTDLTKKKPKNSFNEECLSLQRSIFTHIKKKSDEGVKFQKMENIITKIERMWTVISKFPNLYNSYPKQTRDVMRKLEDYFNKTKKDCIQIEMKNLLEQFKSEKIEKIQMKNKFNDYVERVRKSTQFNNHFTIKEKELAETSEKRRNYRQKFQNYINECFQSLSNMSELILRQKNLKDVVKFGDEKLINKAIEIREKNLPENIQIQIFDQEFQQLSNEILSLIKIDEKLLSFYNTASYLYKKSLQGGIGLPVFDQQILNNNLSKGTAFFKNQILLKFFFQGDLLKNFLRFSTQPPVNIVKQRGKGLYSAERNYFNILEYFEEEKCMYGLYIQKKKINDCLKIQNISKKIREKFLNKNLVRRILERQFSQIKAKMKKYKIQINSPQTFIQNFHSFYLQGTASSKPWQINPFLEGFHRNQTAYQDRTLKQEQLNKYLKLHGTNFSWRNFEAKFSKFINWELLKISVLKEVESFQIKLQIRDSIETMLSKQLEGLGISVKNLLQLIDYVIFLNRKPHVSNFLFAFSFYNSFLETDSYSSFRKKVRSYNFVDSSRLENAIEIKKYEGPKEGYHCMGSYQSEQMFPKRRYAQKFPFLANFSLSSYEDFVEKIRNTQLTQFLQDELVKKRKIQDLLDKIDFFINNQLKVKNKNANELMAVGICQQIKREIKKFNSDLNLAGHALGPTIVGYIHLYGLLIWWNIASNEIYRSQTDIYNKFYTEKENQRELFLQTASNNVEKNSEAEATLFYEMFKKYFELKIKASKEQIIQEEETKFKKDYTLQYVIGQLDKDILNIDKSENSTQNSSSENKGNSTSNRPSENLQSSSSSLQRLKTTLKRLKANKEKESAKSIPEVSPIKKMKDYIKNPFEKVNSYFEDLYEESATSLKNKGEEVLKIGTSEEFKLLKNMKSLLISLKRKLGGKENPQKEENSQEMPKILKKYDSYNIFQKKQILKEGNERKAVRDCLMKYFIDLMLGKQKKHYSTQNVKCYLPQENRIRFTDPLCKDKEIENFFNQIEKTHEISNLLMFVKKVVEIFQAKTEELQKLFQMGDGDLQKHKENIKVNLCKELCPCCGRICGVIHDENNIYHQCKFGHQIRAFGGTRLDSGFASTKRCEEIGENDEVEYDGNIISWSTYKMKVKKERSWAYDDCQNDNLYRAKIFEKVWKFYGPTFCKNYVNKEGIKKEIKYISLEDAKKMSLNYSSSGKPNHYIIVLDESSSMSSTCGSQTRWNALIESVKNLFEEIKKKKNDSLRISLLLMSSSCKVRHENVAISQIDSFPERSGGGTNFEAAFIQVNKIAEKYSKQQNLGVIFMTDGQCSYPEKQVEKLRQLQQKAKKENSKISYFGIQFIEESETMESIRKELNGKTSQPKDSFELMEAYRKAIEILDD